MGDVDADPCPAELLRRRDGRPAAAKRIENNIALIRRRLNYAFEMSDRYRTMSDRDVDYFDFHALMTLSKAGLVTEMVVPPQVYTFQRVWPS